MTLHCQPTRARHIVEFEHPAQPDLPDRDGINLRRNQAIIQIILSTAPGGRSNAGVDGPRFVQKHFLDI